MEGMTVPTVFKSIETANKEHAEKCRRIKAYGKVIPLCAEVVKRHWADLPEEYGCSHRYASMNLTLDGFSINCLGVQLRLGTTDTIKDVHLFIDEIESIPGLEYTGMFHGQEEYFHHLDLNYSYKDSSYLDSKNKTQNPTVMFRFHFEKSENCRLVPTGEMVEKMKMVCG